LGVFAGLLVLLGLLWRRVISGLRRGLGGHGERELFPAVVVFRRQACRLCQRLLFMLRVLFYVCGSLREWFNLVITLSTSIIRLKGLPYTYCGQFSPPVDNNFVFVF
jgi:hypothetical protein